MKFFWIVFFSFFFGIFGGIFANQILWPYFVERPLFLKYKLESPPIYITQKKEIRIQENVALKEAIEKVKDSVFFVRSKTKTGKVLEGSGLILTSDGILITFAELVPQRASIEVFINGQPVSFQILKRDLKENLALIKVEAKNLKTVPFANLEKIKLGERVFLVGEIFEEETIKKSVNEGIIKNFSEQKIETSIFETQKLLGSALFNIEGEFLGLNFLDSNGKIISIPNHKIKSFSGF